MHVNRLGTDKDDRFFLRSERDKRIEKDSSSSHNLVNAQLRHCDSFADIQVSSSSTSAGFRPGPFITVYCHL